MKLKYYVTDSHFQKTAVLFKLKKYEEALQTNEKIVKLGYETPKAYYQRGKIFFEMKKYKEASECFEKEIKISSLSTLKFRCYILTGFCFKELGNHKKAILNVKKGKILAARFNNEKWIKLADKCLSDMRKNN